MDQETIDKQLSEFLKDGELKQESNNKQDTLKNSLIDTDFNFSNTINNPVFNQNLNQIPEYKNNLDNLEPKPQQLSDKQISQLKSIIENNKKLIDAIKN